jgi:membrane-bound lytic murein transglycosylase B
MMHPMIRLLALCLLPGWLLASPVLADQPKQGFASWLQDFRMEAQAAGITQPTLEAALGGLSAPLPRVLELDRKQPESTQTFKAYLAARLSDRRIAKGRNLLKEYGTWLGRVEGRYGVPRRVLVALWGLESNYGESTGGFSVIEALASLAYEGRREALFRKELLEALRILEEGHIAAASMRGSWAGAMGQCQFMPSSFRRFAVDANGDGRRDIWTSVPDVLASSANYLSSAGWKTGQTWGRPVRLPKRFDAALIGLKTRQPISRWRALGVTQASGQPLPGRTLQGSLVRPDGPGGQAYLVYDNFRVLLAWNNSSAFAVTVGTLSDRLVSSRVKNR